MPTPNLITPPFLIQMVSGAENKHCDIYPHGSLHLVQKTETGHTYVPAKGDYIPNHFATKKIIEQHSVKKCNDCKNNFPDNWPFIKNNCIRCYERLNITNRTEYREALKQELLIEIKTTKL